MTGIAGWKRMNTDCIDEKHKACRGDAWNFELDAYSECQCPCHAEQEPVDARAEDS